MSETGVASSSGDVSGLTVTELRAALDARGLPPLPSAVKGGGWGEKGGGTGSELEGYAVLHGQNGGGR